MTETIAPDNLLAGNFPVATKAVTVEAGQLYQVGSVLGEITLDVPTTGAADAGNTGNGTVTGVAGGTNTKLGTYTIVCTVAAVDGGTFKVIDPDGYAFDNAQVASAYSNSHLELTINDGTADYAVGDTFTVLVAAGSGVNKIVDKTAVDGSQHPTSILLGEVDATLADVPGIAARTGQYNEDALILGGATTKDDVRDALEARSIFLETISS